MRRRSVWLAVVLVCLVASSCSRKGPGEAAEQRRATVVLQDGTQVRGTVVSSSAAEITIAGDDNITRAIPTTQVKSIEYADQATPEPQKLAQGEPQPASPGARRAAPRASESREQPPQAVPQTRTYEIPAGTEISVRTNETIDSATAAEGQSYAAEVTTAVSDVSGAAAIPRGAQAQLRIVSASKGGRIRGASDLVLTVDSVTVGGKRYDVDTSNVGQRGKEGLGANKRTAVHTGGGAAVGAIIGAIAGGGKGAAIGAGAGAGAGALTQILTKGKAIQVPAESVLTFKLDQPLRITVAQ